MPDSRPTTSRRRLLLGFGLAVPAAAVVARPTVAAARPTGEAIGEAAPEPECLADLVASGEVTRADFMVG